MYRRMKLFKSFPKSIFRDLCKFIFKVPDRFVREKMWKPLKMKSFCADTDSYEQGNGKIERLNMNMLFVFGGGNMCAHGG